MAELATQMVNLTVAETTMTTNGSTQGWLDRLSTELRLEIFQLAQQHEGVLLVVDKSNKTNRINVSLLVALVNDKKYIEAVEVFYTANTFRVTKYAELRTPATGIRSAAGKAYVYITRLELRNLGKSEEFVTAKRLEQVIKISSQMPKLKELVVAFDSLASGPMATLGSAATLRESLAGMDLLDEWKLECVAVGKYTMSRSKGINITFVHVGLMETWAEMKSSPPVTFVSQVKALKKALKKQPRASVPQGFHGFFLNMTLSAWVAVWENCTRIMDAGAFDDPDFEISHDEFTLIEMFMESFKWTKGSKPMSKVRGRLFVGHAMRELAEESVKFIPDPTVSTKTAEIMEGSTDILRLNSGKFPRLTAGGMDYWRERAGNLGQTLPLPY
ncbi:hypothetical protein LTR56_024343 [Elasticomyces elasticus]|nr:hypothetical protein LTR56_024343 [Elasticomyces elasticus]KAK3623201.1 hypothetical protein LTR22_024500 [Elasticomyces elasticus]KAK4905743.1 hypothetical protein LTR49_024992 [Elasticomyces elasticus]KAK5743215.1 hypothetical protein LTS12_023944 [Elasticomyces elasticus]